jgi:hypothetical protein
MTKPYLDQNPIERAAETKRLAKQAVEDFYERRSLPTATPTVIRDLEQMEQEQ